MAKENALPEGKQDHFNKLCAIIRATYPDISEKEIHEIASCVLASIEITAVQTIAKVSTTCKKPDTDP